jgi:malonate-semialdehyde dehydrogenase (acetylating)/methylmalonate-semialdehyde dehydrogenase
MTNQIGHWIDGKARAGSSGRSAPVHNPATGERTSEVQLASAAEVDDAVRAALAAAGEWRRVSLSRRAGLLFAFRQLLDTHRRELAEAVTAEHGKVLADAEGEVARGVENVEYATGVPHLLKGGYSEQASAGIDVYSMRQPLGVVAGITPFNFPVMVPLWMCANAIACGNAFILKPSERDPSPSLLLAHLWREAGLPDGVFNVVQGDKEAVDAVLGHPDVAAVSFVGSTPIARYVYESGTRQAKRVQALGGAKNHMVVLPDAELDVAADAAVSAAYGSAGERCMAISVTVAVGDIADPLVDAIAARLPKLRVGDGRDPESQMGPLITAEHRQRVAAYIDNAATEGAAVVVDGRSADLPAQGYFLGPTLLDRVEPTMTVSSMPTRTPTARRSSLETAAPPAVSSRTSRSAWWGSTSPSRCRSPTTPSVGGRRRCSATATCTGPRASPFTRGERSSPRAGPIRRRQRSTSAFPATGSREPA